MLDIRGSLSYDECSDLDGSYLTMPAVPLIEKCVTLEAGGLRYDSEVLFVSPGEPRAAWHVGGDRGEQTHAYTINDEGDQQNAAI